MSCTQRLGALMVMVGLFLATPVQAQEEIKLRPANQVSINELITDTQYSTDDPDRVTLVWWLPDEFWAVSLASDPTTTEEGVKEVVDMVSQYTLAVCVDGELGPFGGVKFVQPDQLRSQVRLVNAEGEAVQPMDNADVSPDMMLLIGSMRPVLENMLGPMGQNMSFVVFPRKDSQGRVIADATKAGNFSLALGDVTFPVQTPLPSLLIPKHCATCERTYRGDYNFCPYDRAELAHVEP